jgi:uncharacterized phiE125 gp8 family phage protein
VEIIRVTAGPSVTQTGTLTSGSALVAGLTVASIEGALRVTGAGIPRDTFVASFDSSSQITLTQKATQSGSQPLTFSLEPVTLPEAKLHILAAVDTDDPLIARLITAARQLAEGWFSRCFLASSVRLLRDTFTSTYLSPYDSMRGYERYVALGWPGENGIRVNWADLLTVDGVSYLDVNGFTQTLEAKDYEVYTGPPGHILPAYGTSWPSVRVRPESVRVDFTAGYGPTAASVPDTIKSGLLLLVGHLYENREASSALTLKDTPMATQMLLADADWGRSYIG